MDEHYLEIIGIVLLLVFASTMFYQGTMILRGHRGYRHCEREQKESENIRRRVEELLKDK
jgi:ABC-type nickel/cobalt efflux system permease component RcnA